MIALAFAATAGIALAGADSPTTRECMLPPALQSLWPDPDQVVFHPTTLEERAAFGRLIPPLVAAASAGRPLPEDLVAVAESVGFHLEEVAAGGERLWVLREQRTRLRGAGAYVLRVGEAIDAVVQSPHAYFDLGTGVLAAELFVCAPEHLRPRALITNTAHRFRGRSGEKREDPDHPADVAHNPDHLFQVATDLLAAAKPGLRVFQVHGFGARETRAELAAVVSAGTRTPGAWTRKLASRLGDLWGDGVRLYPDETEILGATRNAQARLLQTHPRTRFVHLELSPDVRRALRSPERIAALAEALFAVEDSE